MKPLRATWGPVGPEIEGGQDMRLRRYMTVAQAAKHLKLSGGRVRQLIAAGRFPGTEKLGRIWLIPKRAVKGYVKQPAGNPNWAKPHG